MSTSTKIFYLLDEEGRRKSLLSGGNGKELQEVVSDSVDWLKIAKIDTDGKASACIGFNYLDKKNDFCGRIVLDIKISNSYGPPRLVETDNFYYFTEPQTAEKLLKWEKERIDFLEKKEKELAPVVEKQYAEWKEEKDKEYAEREDERKKREEEQKKDKNRKRIEKEKRENDKIEWIKSNGSEHLKDALELGYDCQRKYVMERVEKEFPDYILDFDDKANWKDRSCPSEKALTDVKELIKKGFDAEVIWLTDPPYEHNPYEDGEFDEAEAIVIRNYLEKYDCIKM